MRTITASRSRNGSSSFSFSRRHFLWILGRKNGDQEETMNVLDNDNEDILVFAGDEELSDVPALNSNSTTTAMDAVKDSRKKRKSSAMAKLKFALTSAITGQMTSLHKPRILTGTLFGNRKGHVHLAFQLDPKAHPTLLIELSTQTNSLVKEMASGLVRIALECERRGEKKLLEEPMWRAYCNGKKWGYAVRRECGEGDWKVLQAVEAVSMGAGVLPIDDGEVMYLRARFERVVGSKDSEAFYMMSPDGSGNGCGGVPELSVYLLRV